jgi:hypothetical protein
MKNVDKICSWNLSVLKYKVFNIWIMQKGFSIHSKAKIYRAFSSFCDRDNLKRLNLPNLSHIHYGTQLMPSVGFRQKHWWHGHVCLQNEFIVVLWIATAYNQLDVTICRHVPVFIIILVYISLPNFYLENSDDLKQEG